jgi:hypothetical protein
MNPTREQIEQARARMSTRIESRHAFGALPEEVEADIRTLLSATAPPSETGLREEARAWVADEVDRRGSIPASDVYIAGARREGAR